MANKFHIMDLISDAPQQTDAITFEYTSSTVTTVRFRSGSKTGPILASLVITFTDSTQVNISAIERQ